MNRCIAVVLVWALIAVLLAAQGYLVARWRGEYQPWWPALGYSLAIFSVWMLLTPAILAVTDKLCLMSLKRAVPTAIWILGWPVTAAVHVALFVILYWPVYGSKFATPVEMAAPVFLANIDTSAIAYAALTALAYFRRRIGMQGLALTSADGGAAEDNGLWIRMANGKRLVRYQDIDWIAAAGDYAEVHSGNQSHLTDNSLTALVKRLPHNEFVRIHRGAIVRLDRVCEVRGIGRGDASLFLRSGQTLRLSRRYREDLAIHLPL